MSIKIINSVWDSDITGTRLTIMQAFADYADDEGRSIYPSLDRLEWKTGILRRTLQRHIKSLVEDGIITKLGQHPALGTNEYQINIEMLPPKKPFAEWKEGRKRGCQSDTGCQSDAGGVSIEHGGGDKPVTLDPSVLDPSLLDPPSVVSPPKSSRLPKNHPLTGDELKKMCSSGKWNEWQQLIITFQFLRQTTILGSYANLTRTSKAAVASNVTKKLLCETYRRMKHEGFWADKPIPYNNLIQQCIEDAQSAAASSGSAEMSDWGRRTMEEYREKRARVNEHEQQQQQQPL